jgi:hypothetical protein
LKTTSASITRTVSSLAQPLELVDDLAAEVGLVEPEHEQLDRSDRHVRSFLVSRRFAPRRTRARSWSSSAAHP